MFSLLNLSNLKKNKTLILSEFADLEIWQAQLASLLCILQTQNQGVDVAVIPGGSRAGTASPLIQALGRLPLQVAVDLEVLVSVLAVTWGQP